MARRRKPGEDAPISQGSDLTILNVSRQYKTEAVEARRDRIVQNKRNRDAYMGIQDWSDKIEGQSTEFLPKVAMAAEQFSAFIKRALTQFGDWFSVEYDIDSAAAQVMRPEHVRALMMCYFDTMPAGPSKSTKLETILADGAKSALLEAVMILKIHGSRVDQRVFRAEPPGQAVNADGLLESTPGGLRVDTIRPWRLKVELIRPEDFGIDPSGRDLYEFQDVERDFYQVEEDAANGMYDEAAVAAIKEDFGQKREEKRPERQRGQRETTHPDFRRLVRITEFWGTLLDKDGKVVHRNVFWAIANDKYVIRKPKANPFWHQESPFVVIPLIRLPHSVWHKALYDHAVPLNFALNDMFNLIFDGGLAAVWGTRQLRTADLEDEEDVTGGIPQGKTLSVSDSLPHGAKVLETVTTGSVPTDAMAVFEMLSRELLEASLSNDIGLGSLPPRQVLATEVIESNSAQAVTVDAITSDMEAGIESLIRKSWLTLLQNADSLDSQAVESAIGKQAAVQLALMDQAQRFAAFAPLCRFRVHGLSATLARVRDFQKTAALMQMVVGNPILFQSFIKRFSGDKILSTIMKQLNINPLTMEMDAEEQAGFEENMAELVSIMQMLQGGGQGQGQGPGGLSPDGGEPGLPAEVNQQGNPITGMVGP
jgi:hypothetical protein